MFRVLDNSACLVDDGVKLQQQPSPAFGALIPDPDYYIIFFFPQQDLAAALKKCVCPGLCYFLCEAVYGSQEEDTIIHINSPQLSQPSRKDPTLFFFLVFIHNRISSELTSVFHRKINLSSADGRNSLLKFMCLGFFTLLHHTSSVAAEGPFSKKTGYFFLQLFMCLF